MGSGAPDKSRRGAWREACPPHPFWPNSAAPPGQEGVRFSVERRQLMREKVARANAPAGPRLSVGRRWDSQGGVDASVRNPMACHAGAAGCALPPTPSESRCPPLLRLENEGRFLQLTARGHGGTSSFGCSRSLPTSTNNHAGKQADPATCDGRQAP